MRKMYIAIAFVLAGASTADAGPSGRGVNLVGWGCRDCGYTNGTSRNGLARSRSFSVTGGSEQIIVEFPKQSIDVETNKLKRPYGR